MTEIEDMLRLGITIALFLGMVTVQAHGGSGIYQWQDEQGRVHFTDNPERIPVQYWHQLPNNTFGSPASQRTSIQRTRILINRRLGAVTIPVKINGTHRIPLFLDTGATYCQITAADVRALGLDVDHLPPVRVMMADGRSLATRMVILDSLKIGSLEIRRVEALVGDLRLLGLNVLELFRITMDLPRGEIILELPP